MRVLRGREGRRVEVGTGDDARLDVEVRMGVEVDGLEMGADMEGVGGAGVEKNFVLAAERAPLMKESG